MLCGQLVISLKGTLRTELVLEPGERKQGTELKRTIASKENKEQEVETDHEMGLAYNGSIVLLIVLRRSALLNYLRWNNSIVCS